MNTISMLMMNICHFKVINRHYLNDKKTIHQLNRKGLSYIHHTFIRCHICIFTLSCNSLNTYLIRCSLPIYALIHFIKNIVHPCLVLIIAMYDYINIKTLTLYLIAWAKLNQTRCKVGTFVDFWI